MMKDLWKRVASTLILLPIVIWLIVQGGYATTLLLTITAFLCFLEYAYLDRTLSSTRRWIFIFLGTGSFSIAMLDGRIEILWFCAIATFILRVLDLIVVEKRQPIDIVDSMAVGSMGLLWIWMGVWALHSLRTVSYAVAPFDEFRAVLMALVVTWSNDTAAYFAGNWWGKHPMAPTVSPKKSWEGFVGGIIGAMLSILVFHILMAYITQQPILIRFIAIDILAIALPASFLGPVGDLFESALKRSVSAKDSGSIIPGHGGILDRLDAVFFVAPWVYFYLQFLRPHLF